MSSAFCTYLLYYFNQCKWAKPIPLIFAHGNEKFEVIRYEKDDWSRFKSEMPLKQLLVLGRNLYSFEFFFLEFTGE